MADNIPSASKYTTLVGCQMAKIAKSVLSPSALAVLDTVDLQQRLLHDKLL